MHLTKLELSVYLGMAALIAFLFMPPILRSNESRSRAQTYGPRTLRTGIIKVKPAKGGAILVAVPRRERGFRIDLEQKSESEWSQNSMQNLPVSIPVRAGTKFRFNFRHSGSAYKVTAIDRRGVEIEIFGTAPWFGENEKIVLPYKTAAQ